jgi:integrase/recombinase XerD
MKKRIPPKQLGVQLAKLLKKQAPDANYVKKVFQHVRRELGFEGKTPTPRKLPELLAESEVTSFYETVWNGADTTHMVMIKLLLYTGIRNFELANIELNDVDLKALTIRIESGKGKKDRYVPLPASFRGELTQYVAAQRKQGTRFLFETRLNDKFTTRWISEIVKRYAVKAGIEKRIYPHLFRHQLLTYLTKKGIVDAKIQLISGHRDRQSLAIYQTMSLADVDEEYQEAMRDFPVR